MTPEQMARLFQEFTQADASTTRKYGGTGPRARDQPPLLPHDGRRHHGGERRRAAARLHDPAARAPRSRAEPSAASRAARRAVAPSRRDTAARTGAGGRRRRDRPRPDERFLASEGFSRRHRRRAAIEGLRLARASSSPAAITLDVHDAGHRRLDGARRAQGRSRARRHPGDPRDDRRREDTAATRSGAAGLPGQAGRPRAPGRRAARHLRRRRRRVLLVDDDDPTARAVCARRSSATAGPSSRPRTAGSALARAGRERAPTSSCSTYDAGDGRLRVPRRAARPSPSGATSRWSCVTAKDLTAEDRRRLNGACRARPPEGRATSRDELLRRGRAASLPRCAIERGSAAPRPMERGRADA